MSDSFKRLSVILTEDNLIFVDEPEFVLGYALFVLICGRVEGYVAVLDFKLHVVIIIHVGLEQPVGGVTIPGTIVVTGTDHREADAGTRADTRRAGE